MEQTLTPKTYENLTDDEKKVLKMKWKLLGLSGGSVLGLKECPFWRLKIMHHSQFDITPAHYEGCQYCRFSFANSL